jgi:apolipoprotein N-acyltransferase
VVIRRDVALAALAGALLALSFPKFGHPACAWIALVPLFLALSGWTGRPGPLRGTTAARGAFLGLVTSLVFFCGTLYWTGPVLVTFGGLPGPLGVVSVLLLSLYLGLYNAVGTAALGVILRRFGAAGFWLAPMAWVSGEYLRGTLLSGFPWVVIGDTQVDVLPVAQVASVLGLYGVSLLVAFVNGALAYALLAPPRMRVRTIAGTAAVLLSVAVWGAWRVADGSLTRAGSPIRVGLLQGNIEQKDKWDPGQARRIFTTYIAMTRDAVRRGAEYVMWPESSTPFMFEENAVGGQQIRDLAAEVRVPLLFGSDQIVRGATPHLYNAAFLVTPDRRTAAVYRKMQLVPFGEFIPLQHWISFLSPLVGGLATFAAGESVTMLPIGDHKASTAICYEVIFPHLAREAVERGSELLTTITNDGWYGTTSAPYQHFALASMRAIEQGRYLVRAANTGISGAVDPYGRVVAKSAIFEQTGVVVDVRFLQGRTIYSRIGDVAAYASLAITALALVAGGRRTDREPASSRFAR